MIGLEYSTRWYLRRRFLRRSKVLCRDLTPRRCQRDAGTPCNNYDTVGEPPGPFTFIDRLKRAWSPAFASAYSSDDNDPTSFSLSIANSSSLIRFSRIAWLPSSVPLVCDAGVSRVTGASVRRNALKAGGCRGLDAPM